MTDGISGVSGYGNYGVGGYAPRKRDDAAQEAQENNANQTAVNPEETQVDPERVMEFLANNNYFIAPAETAAAGEVDDETANRVAGYMEQFEMIYGLVQEEFGEELAPAVMDLVMDKLIEG